jgi:hypothetical protein
MKFAVVNSTRSIPIPPYLPGQSPAAAPSLPGQGNPQQPGTNTSLPPPPPSSPDSLAEKYYLPSQRLFRM